MSITIFDVQINDLPNILISNIKLFADETSIFSIVYNINVFTGKINNDLHRTSDWAYQQKTIFNPTKTKQAQEVPLLQKVSLNNIPVVCSASPKHLSLDTDQKLNFNKDINKKNSTAQKGKSVIYKIF